MHEIDDSFRRQKERSAAARRRRKLHRLGFWTGLSCAVVAGCAAVFYLLPIPPFRNRELLGPPAKEVPNEIPAFAPTIVDLPGNPLRIQLGGDQAARSNMRKVDAPPTLQQLGVSGSITILSEKVLPSTERLMTAIPSTQQDFMFFQAQSADQARPLPRPAASAVPATASNAEPPKASPGADAAPPAAAVETIVPAQARIENNVTTVALKAEALRAREVEDVVLKTVAAIDPLSFLIENNTDPASARQVSNYLKSSAGLSTLQPNSVIAMREFPASSGSVRRLAQIAIYQDGQFVVAMAIGDDGKLAPAADPWVDQNLFQLEDTSAESMEARRYRLLDGIYSVGVRNGVSTGLVGEVIMLLSHGHDLGEFATSTDRVTLIYSGADRSGGEGIGRILYVGVDREKSPIECFVFKSENGGDFACTNERGNSQVVALTNNMVTPVAGVLSSGFGPRIDPVSKAVTVSKGVDWVAPVGTPVHAAYSGIVTFAGDSGDLGNVLKLDHGGGRLTGYAHLSAFATGLAVGASVQAGDTIGYVGTSGSTRGPSLHFESYVNGQPVNPLQADIASDDAAGDFLERLVNRIIRIESGGDPNAANPLSTAVGYGQFIESTWLRMMRTYRPDLGQTLSRDQLLALRVDPTLSREMVMNLVRENKSYLEARGAVASPGNIYLAHFLGPDGAATMLTASQAAPAEAVLGSAVITANPFLRGKDVADVEAWAAQRMGSVSSESLGVPSSTKLSTDASSAFAQYKAAILDLMAPAAGKS
jgi:murein DD-endopeptidase MepM/ murein hydrolase activator NlpD